MSVLSTNPHPSQILTIQLMVGHQSLRFFFGMTTP